MVGGGIGQTPFMALARESLGSRRYGDPPRVASRASRVTLCYGARRGEYLAGVPDFERLGVDVHISTDDGSAGHHGLVTDVLRCVLDAPSPPAPLPQRGEGSKTPAASRRIICCGPMPMMRAVAEMARAAEVPCWASLETPMACGIGICFSCVAKIADAAGDWDYRRTCVEGPVIAAERIGG